MREYSDVVIIGAGAAGLMCGGLLASEGISVTIIDKNTRVGRKLSATGNGRCNFTNCHMNPSCYYGDEGWIKKILLQYSPEDAIRQFASLGVYHRERDGYVYPYTNQAVTVVEALYHFCRKNHARIVLDAKVSSVKRDGKGGYIVRTSPGENTSGENTSGERSCRYVILATGGKAGSDLGGGGSGYKLARSLGHPIHTIYPGLTGLVCKGDWWKQVSGTRIQGSFSLLTDNNRIEGEQGEIQIVRDGVSGIPVFQMCRVAAKALSEGKYVEGVIDFVPSMNRQELLMWLSRHGIEGLVPKKWVPVLKNRTEPDYCLKEFRFPIEKTFGIERAQVTAGGVSTEEVEAETMESKIAPGVFLAGELLDVDGKCGGYNLHFAWACANIAAKEIIRKEKGSREYAPVEPV